MLNPHIFRAYDIRGIADPVDGKAVDLTAETAYLIGRGVGTYLVRKYGVNSMAVGRDNRLTGPMLQEAYVRGILECGISVFDIGIATSPMLYFSVCAFNFDSGTAITASHNPKEYNGFKVVSSGAHSVCGDEFKLIYDLIEKGDFAVTEKPGQLHEQEVWGKYLVELASRVSLKRKLKVVVDCGNATPGKFAPELFRHIGCDVIELHCELDGNFPNHEANPEELHNMLDLIEAVKDHHADIGIGFDGDGDRVGVVDEKGQHYSADYLLLLLARELAGRCAGQPVVFDVKVSQVIINEMAALGLVPVMSKTGHSFIEAKMKELNAPLGGEVSGHMFFGEDYYGFDDAFLAAVKILQILAAETHPLSQMFNSLPKVYNTPEIKFPCADDKKFILVGALVAHFTKLYPCITIDGVRVNFTDSAWGAVRASNTSPNLTLRFEAESSERLEEIQREMMGAIEELGN
ncbi:phosphomannomutase/phosphoglucomutase [Candidatus Gracilibacteria bacterium]|nr:phosphomannomutase/phosphoglucomutase [Candidatus Gracilibacteria bacterium]